MAEAVAPGVASAGRLPAPAEPRLSAGTRERLLGVALLGPALVLIFGLIAYPVLYDVALALTDARGFSAPGQFVGFANFATVFTSEEFWPAAGNAALYTVFTATLRVIIGVAIALTLWRLRRGRTPVFLAIFTTWVFPAALSTFAFYWLLSPPFHTFYTLPLLQVRFALAALLGQDLWKVGSIAFHDIWRTSAFIAIFVLAGLNSLPHDPLDYAATECRSGWQRLRHVILPMVRKFLILALLLSLVVSFMDYSTAYIQTGGRIIWPLVGTLAYKTSFYDGDTALGAAITLTQLPLWFLVLWVGFRFFSREPHTPVREEVAPAVMPAVMSRTVVPPRTAVSGLPAPRTAAAVASISGRTRPWRRLWKQVGWGGAALLIVVFSIFPIWWIVLQALRPPQEDSLGNPFWTWHPSFAALFAAFEGRNVWIWLLNTFIVLVVGVTITLTASLLAGYALGRLRIPGREWIARLILASYFLPQPMVLVPMYQLFVALNLDNTLIAVILINQTLTIPFATWLFFTYFQGLPAEVEEHASLDASRWRVFRRIVLPMSWPVVIAAGIFAAGVMMSEFVYASLILVHNDVKTVAVGLGIIAISLDEFNEITGGIAVAAIPLVLACALFAPSYVRGLSAAMVEGA